MCPVPGRLHSASSYSGARKSRRYRVGDPRTRSRDRFTLRAMAKGGAFMRREKKRSIKGGTAVNPERQKSNIFTKKYLLNTLRGNESQKNNGKRHRWKEREAWATQSKWTSRGVSLKKSRLRTDSLILRSHLKSKYRPQPARRVQPCFRVSATVSTSQSKTLFCKQMAML